VYPRPPLMPKMRLKRGEWSPFPGSKISGEPDFLFATRDFVEKSLMRPKRVYWNKLFGHFLAKFWPFFGPISFSRCVALQKKTITLFLVRKKSRRGSRILPTITLENLDALLW